MAVDLGACTHCEAHPGVEHQDWHVTRGQALSIGREMLRRAVAKEAWEIKRLPDAVLRDYHATLKRQLLTAEEDGLPDFLVDLAVEWFNAADKELSWRERAALKGGPVVARGGDWVPRIDAVKRDVDLAFLIAYECDGAKPAGPGKWVCCCPFHDDRDPSMSIDVAKGLWKCHGCGVGGDAITYVRLRHGLTFPEAIEHLEARLGIERPKPTATFRTVEL